MSDQITYCWDTSVFLAWIKSESSSNLGDIDLVATEIDAGRACLLVPVTAFAEILDAKNTPEQMAQFRAFLNRSNVYVADTALSIAEKAGQIRSRTICDTSAHKVRTADSLFIATAIVFRATVFHTLDTRLLPLNGSPLVDNLAIAIPAVWRGPRSLFGQFFS